jgi:hypothetical protein
MRTLSLIPSLTITGALLWASMAASGCGGGMTTRPGGSGGAGGSALGEINRPCADAMRIGGFELVLVAPAAAVEGYAQLIGTVQDRVNPTKVWQSGLAEGDCRLMLGPTCSTSCPLPTVCDGASCVAGPTTKTVGTVTVSGLTGGALSAMPNSQKNYYAPATGVFPPVAPGAAVVLTASGGDYAGFSLNGAGFPVIASPSTALPFEMGKPFTVTWTPPQAPVATRMSVKVDIAFHGGVDAQIQCDTADDGSICQTQTNQPLRLREDLCAR